MSKNRVHLQFSKESKEEQEVLALLKDLGRTKSAFITDAVLFFILNNVDIDIRVSEKNRETVKMTIREICTNLSDDLVLKYKLNSKDVRLGGVGEGSSHSIDIEKNPSHSNVEAKKPEEEEALIDELLMGLDDFL